jgi:hypothetical protein
MTVDEVETRTGLDFFAELPVAEQAVLEAAYCVACWD